ncbi:hypothetical protein SeMB42_g07389 [Synchytrium endobioticum]|uniref:Uncharacterized protein n=1 Tax=Synchytrium endobioticum TaxID=286115 RepID=A0A507CK66_9FUNG|nr:hypothetical protein SeMB42_g07389 [Synchytrium endobioticum]TPX39939.1 hypothetical protein SeLEV6574_g06914 [Synchytrium endobioticum]
MALITDAEYLIYRMRLSLLSVTDPLTERIISLPTESDNDYILAEQPTSPLNHLYDTATTNNNKNVRIRTTAAPSLVSKTDARRRTRLLGDDGDGDGAGAGAGAGAANNTSNSRLPQLQQSQHKMGSATLDAVNDKGSSNMTTTSLISAARTTTGIKSPESAKTPDSSGPGSPVPTDNPDQTEAARHAQLRELRDLLAAEERKAEALAMEIPEAFRDLQVLAPTTQAENGSKIPASKPESIHKSYDRNHHIRAHSRTVSEASSAAPPEKPEDDDNKVFPKPPLEAGAIDCTSEQSGMQEEQASQTVAIPSSAPRNIEFSTSRESDVSYDEFAAVDDDMSPQALYMRMDDLDKNPARDDVIVTNKPGSVSAVQAIQLGDPCTTSRDRDSNETIGPQNSTAAATKQSFPAQNPDLLNQVVVDPLKGRQERTSTVAKPSATLDKGHTSQASQLPSKSSLHQKSVSKSLQGNLFAKRDMQGPDSEAKRLVTSVNRLTSQSPDSMRTFDPPVSSLTNLINERANTSNPFAEDYLSFSGKGDPDSVKIKIYIPFREDQSRPLIIKVKRDGTVEEVIGYILYEYINQSIIPSLPERLWDVVMWCLRIVEDDGSIDDDFPALERSRKIHKFAFDQFALCEASDEQVAAEKARRAAAIKFQTVNNAAVTTPTSATSNNISASKILYIRVHLYSTIEVKQTTTLQLPGTTLLSEVFEQVCKKRKYEPKDYVLKMVDTKTDVALDKTLADLRTTEFCILKRDRGGAGDIFLRPPDEIATGDDEPHVLISDEYTSMYKQYTVLHKHFMGKQERTLTIDGEYIHVLASENRSLFDSAKTNSHHISTVVSSKVSKKQSPHFKLVVQKVDKDFKSYDLEALSANEAAEICARITVMARMVKKDVAGTTRASSLMLIK